MRQLRIHGQDRRYNHPLIGVNARLDTLQAAILLAKFTIFPDEVERRQQVAKVYQELFGGAVRTPVLAEGCTSVYAQYTIRVEKREQMQQGLQDRGIPTAVHYPVPLHLQPAFDYLGHVAGQFPESERAAAEVMSLPMHPYLNHDEQQQIVDAVLALI